MGKKYELIFEVDLKIDLEDGSYDTCIEEFDFNLDPAIQVKLINEEKFVEKRNERIKLLGEDKAEEELK